jgi:hypothetical protein
VPFIAAAGKPSRSMALRGFNTARRRRSKFPPSTLIINILLPKSALEQAFRDVRQVVLILEVRDQAVSVARILRLTG